MTTTRPDLPDFDNPPVIEVAISVQFETLHSLRTKQLGLLAKEFEKEFPIVEEHPPRNPSFEEFGLRKPPKLEVKIEKGIMVPRLWFLNDAGTGLIQVQQDRLVHNWRKIDDKDKYPRYENVKEKFMETLNTFRQFLDQEKVGELVPNQCELTYVNNILQDEAWEHYGQIDRLFTVWRCDYSNSFLQEPDEVQFSVRYIIPGDDGQPIGRLHINVQPAIRKKDGTPIIEMSLTARGRPAGVSVKDVSAFLDIGRKWIVKGFTSITSKEMHQHWRRLDEH